MMQNIKASLSANQNNYQHIISIVTLPNYPLKQVVLFKAALG
jgi:hypothetical protein